MRISDWSSDVCSSDLIAAAHHVAQLLVRLAVFTGQRARRAKFADQAFPELLGAQAVLAFARAHERRGLDTGNQHVLLAKNAQPHDRPVQIGRASCREECVSTCRSRWSPDN